MRRSMPWHGWGDLAIAAGFALEENAAGAWPHMARAFERGGHDPELLVRLGGVALMLKEDLSARDYFSVALAIEPGMPGAVRGLEMAREMAAGG